MKQYFSNFLNQYYNFWDENFYFSSLEMIIYFFILLIVVYYLFKKHLKQF